MQLCILCPGVDKSRCLKSLFVMGLYNDPGVIMGGKDSVIIIKEASRYTNEELVLKKRFSCMTGERSWQGDATQKSRQRREGGREGWGGGGERPV